MKTFKDCDKDGQFRVNQAKKECAGDLNYNVGVDEAKKN